MEQNFQTSFIPKKPIIKERSISPRTTGLFMIIALFLLFATLIATGGLYFYKATLTKKISTMDNDLNLAQNRFESSKISELQTLDKRLKASTELLGKHIAVTPIFDALELVTMKTVRFTKFSYTINEGENPSIDVKLSGMAVGYRSIALQSDLFAKNKSLIDPIFSNLTLDPKGNVLFELNFSVDPSLVNYKQTIPT